MRQELGENDLPNDCTSAQLKSIAHADKLRIHSFDSLPDADADRRKCRRADRHDRSEIIQPEPEQADDAVDDCRQSQPDHDPGFQKNFRPPRQPHCSTKGNAEGHRQDQSEANAKKRLI